MAKMGDGYGSEAHLLRFLGRHRNLLNQRVLDCLGGSAVDWLDFGFDSRKPWQDAETTGVDFLPADSPARTDWGTFWPRTGTPPTWDAIGKMTIGGAEEWLLVEAKANVQELQSSCKAKPEGGLSQITAAMDATKAALHVPCKADWLHGYYQFCNRIVTLHHLGRSGVAARLLLIYFCGDRPGPGRDCPADEMGWKVAMAELGKHVRLPQDHPLSNRIHKLFLPVCSPIAEVRIGIDRSDLPP